ELGSFTLAAETMRTTQAAVSLKLKRHGRAMRLRLFRPRSGVRCLGGM
ncbi:LysR family transcriptional regulator, partial [Bradyrhizobium sp.]